MPKLPVLSSARVACKANFRLFLLATSMACLCSLNNATAAPTIADAVPAEPSGPVPVLPPKPAESGIVEAHLNRFVPSGTRQRIDFVTTVNPDCSPQGNITAREVDKPIHGRLIFQESDEFAVWSPPNPRVKCNEKRVHGLLVLYESEPGYIGKEDSTVLFILPDSSAVQHYYAIQAK